MDLKDFVSTALKEIVEGVKEAQKVLTDDAINPRMSSKMDFEKLGLVTGPEWNGVQMVKFDVALSTSEGTSTQGKAGVFIAPFMFGTQGQSMASGGTVSRLQFQVPLALPTRKNQ